MKTARAPFLPLILFAVLPGSLAAQAVQTSDLAADAHKTVAVVSGQMHFKSLHGKVEVLRDRWGVAHIYAQNQHDLFFAQGVVAAQDRLFQMELWKRSGQGRLAEILGPSALPRDVNARALRYRGDMRAEYESYAPDTLAILTAFTDGINAYVASLTAPGGPGLPIEFQLAGFSPDPWHPGDCLNRMAAFSMTGNAFGELEHARALVDLGAEQAAKLFNFDPAVPLDPAPGLDLTGLSPDLLQNLIGSDHRIQFPAHAREGSNNWTISGSRTATGKPLLANDPHRVIGLPSLRYMVHLVAPGWNVTGAGEPGLPGVALGHNEHIAWGFTIFGLDQQDLYVEELNPANPLQYKTESGWRDMEKQHEVFHMKGAPDFEIDLKFTRHGPVLWSDGKRALALRWVGSEPGTAGYLASLAIDRAQNWDQFEAAIPRWKVPSENLVYADIDGNIGEHSAGLAPIRKWTGLLPVPGSATSPKAPNQFEWSGFVPANELPHSFNPKQGFIATANHKMIPDRYPYNVGFEWAPPYRFHRVQAMIEDARKKRHKLTVKDMESFQTDVTSLPALEFQKFLTTLPIFRDNPALDGFFKWDGRLTRESPYASVYEVWFRQITEEISNLFSPRINSQPNSQTNDARANTPQTNAPKPAHPQMRYGDLPPDAVLSLLKNPPADLFGHDPQQMRNGVLIMTWASTAQQLEKLLGSDSPQWSWGKLHTVKFRHALDQQPNAHDLFDLGRLSRPGDEYTVNATGPDGDSWEQASGASYREILDTSDWDRSVAVNTPGQSGQPGSPHYSDLMPLWDAGEYFPMAYSRQAVENQTTDRLTLEP